MSAEILIALFGGFVTLGGIVLTFVATRGKTSSDAKTAQEARIDARVQSELNRVYGRLDVLETTTGDQKREIESLTTEVNAWRRRWGAVGRVFRALAAQWPGDHMPHLDPLDIAELEDTIPPAWIRRPTP